MSYRGNPYLLSPRGLLAYNTEHGLGEHANGGALFMTSNKLIGAYVDGIAHINVSPELLEKISKEDVTHFRNYHGSAIQYASRTQEFW